MKVAVITLGCKVNLYESEIIKNQFLESGYQLVGLKENPNIIVINTCSVTNQSDAKSKKIIRQARKLSKEGILVVCGCSSEHHKEKFNDLNIDILLGNKDKSKIVDYVEDYLLNKKKIIKFYDLKNDIFESMSLSNEPNRTRAFVKIQDGCNNYCTYCIIPYLRGSIRSKNLNDAYVEIKSLVENGYKEIVLTGINTGSYGTNENYTLVDLIKKISLLKNLERIRVSSIEVTEIKQDFLNELKINPKLCSHLHIPLQSGSDLILKNMNRKYNTKYYFDIISKIRKIRKDINITTDLIVGFPTETDACFKETLRTLAKIKFGKIHVFPYSKREATAANYFKSIVDDKTKKERVKKILELSDRYESLYYQKFIGKELNVLIEINKEGKSLGYSDNYINIIVNKTIPENTIYRCLITEVVNNKVIGK